MSCHEGTQGMSYVYAQAQIYSCWLTAIICAWRQNKGSGHVGQACLLLPWSWHLGQIHSCCRGLRLVPAQCFCFFVSMYVFGNCLICAWYTYIYIYTHTHTHTYIYIYIYIYTHTHTPAWGYVDYIYALSFLRCMWSSAFWAYMLKVYCNTWASMPWAAAEGVCSVVGPFPSSWLQSNQSNARRNSPLWRRAWQYMYIYIYTHTYNVYINICMYNIYTYYRSVKIRSLYAQSS